MPHSSRMRKLVVAPIRFYRYAISPMMASHCRFYPSCSCYALEAIEQHGVLRGGWLSLFIGAVLVGGSELLPVLCVAILPAWLLATGRPEMRADAVASPSPG